MTAERIKRLRAHFSAVGMERQKPEFRSQAVIAVGGKKRIWVTYPFEGKGGRSYSFMRDSTGRMRFNEADSLNPLESGVEAAKAEAKRHLASKK